MVHSGCSGPKVTSQCSCTDPPQTHYNHDASNGTGIGDVGGKRLIIAEVHINIHQIHHPLLTTTSFESFTHDTSRRWETRNGAIVLLSGIRRDKILANSPATRSTSVPVSEQQSSLEFESRFLQKARCCGELAGFILVPSTK
ncbi:hypothetical protein PM082_007061 [Marasmius tenuissimus]|nr:hypothetical protein PM082_007061 [Marasmius tenuissimus]